VLGIPRLPPLGVSIDLIRKGDSMKIKFEKKVAPTLDQLEELTDFIKNALRKHEENPQKLEHGQYFNVRADGNHGVYTYRVNVSYQLVTVKEVK